MCTHASCFMLIEDHEKKICREKTGVVIHSKWGQQSDWKATLIESLIYHGSLGSIKRMSVV